MGALGVSSHLGYIYLELLLIFSQVWFRGATKSTSIIILNCEFLVTVNFNLI